MADIKSGAEYANFQEHMALCHHMTQKIRTMVNQQTQTTKSRLGSFKFYLIKSEAVTKSLK